MFIGHFAVAFALKPLVPRVSLGTLFISVELADLIWPPLVLAGIERVEIVPGITQVNALNLVSIAYSHSLAMLALWGLMLGAGYFWKSRDPRGALLLFAGVLSHWVLDVIAHRPDMPLVPGSGPLLGLSLWNSRSGTLLVEGGLFALGVATYLRSSRAKDRSGVYLLIALLALLVITYLGSLWAPPPPSVTALAWSAQSVWLLIGLAYGTGRHREPLS